MLELAESIRDTEDLVSLVVQHGDGVYAWRTVETDLLVASLDFDSSLEGPAAVRAAADESRVLVFNAEPLSIEIEVAPSRISGRIVPPTTGQILVETTQGPTFHVDADELGFFVLPVLGAGPVRLRCETPTGRLVTEWVRL
jgi:hypothetical protein